MDLHQYVYDDKAEQFGTGYSDVYDQSINWTDRLIAAVLAKLDDVGALQKTIVVIAADHGEAQGERGFEGHARNVYPENVEVPWILSLPFRLQRGIVIRKQTANVDIFPTVLELLGLPAMEGADGRSRMPEILAAARGEPEPPEDEALAIAHLDQTWGKRIETTSPNVTIGDGRFRYVQFRGPEGQIREQLFDAEHDPRELENRLEEEPEVAKRLAEAAERYLASRPAWDGESGKLEIDEMELDQLRALGYSLP
jgi:arylsulfatase A-like enzyme